MPKSFIRSRSLAFIRQQGRCYYCGSPMWAVDVKVFATRYRITVSQAEQFQCTGEHLVALQDGGNNRETNVVAACLFCNRHRHHHRPCNAPQAEAYKHLVGRQMRKKRWFGALILRAD